MSRVQLIPPYFPTAENLNNSFYG